MIPQDIAKSRHLLRSKPYVDISLEIANAVANFANSAGCIRSGPMTSHDRDPLISCGLNIVAKSSSIINP